MFLALSISFGAYFIKTVLVYAFLPNWQIFKAIGFLNQFKMANKNLIQLFKPNLNLDSTFLY